jgi:hypothetical protein
MTPEGNVVSNGTPNARSWIPTALLQAELRGYLDANSPLRTECKIILTGPNVLHVKGGRDWYAAILDGNNIKIENMKDTYSIHGGMVPISIEVASNPESEKIENMYDTDKIGKVFVEEEEKIYKRISEKPGNETLLILRTPLTVLHADGYYDKINNRTLYGLSIFENFGVIRGYNLEIVKSPIRS